MDEANKTISIYFLCKFGLSNRIAKTLCGKRVELIDFFVRNNHGLFNKISKNKIEKINLYLSDCILEINKNPNIFDDIRMLYSVGAKLEFSKIYHMTDSIDELVIMLRNNNWMEMGLKSASVKAAVQIDKYSDLLFNFNIKNEILKWKTFTIFLEKFKVRNSELDFLGLQASIIKQLEDMQLIFKSQVDDAWCLFIENLTFSEEIIKVYGLDMELYLKERRFKSGIEENLISIDSFFQSSFKDINFLKERLDGKTLEEIGNSVGITRERVRQKINNSLKRIPKIYEVEKFKDLYQRFDISEDIFNTISESDSRLYNLMGLLYTKGEEDILDEILKGNYSDEVKRYILKKRNRFASNGRVLKLTRENYIIDILRRYKNLQLYFKTDELFYLIKEEANDFPQISPKSERALESQLNRYQHIVFSLGKGYRYHPLEIKEYEKQELLSLFENLDDGAYSMNYIFETNPGVMERFDILSGSELHNICKKYNIVTENIRLGRNPEFVAGEKDKKDYIVDNMSTYEGISLEEFCIDMNQKFGLHKGSLSSFISSKLRKYILDGKIHVDKSNYNEIASNILPYLNRYIYSKQDFISIIKKYSGLKEVSQSLIFSLGFILRGELVISSKYRGAKDALTTLILSQKVFHADEISFKKTVDYYSTIYNLEKKLKILKISENTYINVEFMIQRGFKLEKLKSFIREIEILVPSNSYFSIISLLNDGIEFSLLDDGIELISLDRLINISNTTKPVSVGFPNIYFKGDVKRNLNDFLVDSLLQLGSANIEDFTDDLNKKYGINLDEYNVRLRLVECGAYYSDKLNKIYINKEDFLEEVFGR